MTGNFRSPRGRAFVAVAIAVLSGSVSCAPGLEPADLVLVGGDVITLSDGSGVAEAMAVRGERIVAVGTERQVRALVGEATRIIELEGRSVIPGLGDNHLHSVGGGPGVDLSRARSIEDVVTAIASRAAEAGVDEVIVTNSDWHEGQLAEQHLPYLDDLDRAAPTHAVVVVRGGHEYILNSVALERWGITRSTPDMAGGRIGRYADGRLNGELVDRAKDLVSLPPQPSLDRATRKEALFQDYALLASRGLTSVRHPGGSVAEFEMIRELEEEGRLNLRVEYLFRAPRSGSPEALVEAMATWPDPDDYHGRLRIGGVKHGVDGGFEGGLMREPYEEPWGEGGVYLGLQTIPREPFIESVRTLHEAGWRVATHAVGDAAIDLVLDAYEAANRDGSIVGERWVLEHGFIPRDDQFPRMRALGVVASLQDHLYLAAPSLIDYWGAERAAWTTPMRAYLDAGIPVSLGTDSPVVPYDPWWVLHHFTTRQTISAGVVGPDQAVSRLDALRAATEGYAYLTFSEQERGRLVPGLLADFAVTSQSYLDCPDPCLETMQVDLTVVGGQIVWER